MVKYALSQIERYWSMKKYFAAMARDIGKTFPLKHNRE
jgi:hypothetical protein